MCVSAVAPRVSRVCRGRGGRARSVVYMQVRFNTRRSQQAACARRRCAEPRAPRAESAHSGTHSHTVTHSVSVCHTRHTYTLTHTTSHETLERPTSTRRRALYLTAPSLCHQSARLSEKETPHAPAHVPLITTRACLAASRRARFAGFYDPASASRLAGSTRHDSLTKSSTRCALGHLESLRPRRTTPRAKSTS